MNKSYIIISLISIVLFSGCENYDDLEKAEEIGIDTIKKETIKVDPAEVRSENDGKLIYLADRLLSENFVDPDTKIIIEKCFKVNRTVEMYQYEEREDEVHKPKKYYTARWCSYRIDSDKYEDKNFVNPEFPVKNKKFDNNNTKIGMYPVSASGYMEYSFFYSLLSKKTGEIVLTHSFDENVTHNKVGNLKIKYEIYKADVNVSLIGRQEKGKINILYMEDGIRDFEEIVSNLEKKLKEKKDQERLLASIKISLVLFLLLPFIIFISPFLLSVFSAFTGKEDNKDAK